MPPLPRLPAALLDLRAQKPRIDVPNDFPRTSSSMGPSGSIWTDRLLRNVYLPSASREAVTSSMLSTIVLGCSSSPSVSICVTMRSATRATLASLDAQDSTCPRLQAIGSVAKQSTTATTRSSISTGQAITLLKPA